MGPRNRSGSWWDAENAPVAVRDAEDGVGSIIRYFTLPWELLPSVMHRS